MPGPCPTTERLAAVLRGRQPADGEAELAAHLSECPTCQTQLEALAGGSTWPHAKSAMAGDPSPSESLRGVMNALESRAESETSSPPNLDFLEPSDDPALLGRFASYDVLAHVASGGMGVVLKARDTVLDRIVALKILPPALAANSLARARFVREARAAAAVVHEHVVPIHAVDECAGLPYLVMQFVPGRSLAERVRLAPPLRLEEILRIGVQTAAGLAAAHAQGLVHRDVKPGNILLENSVERVKLTDFGLARAVDDAGFTRTGELAGTPEFMAPEQASNEAVDHRSDLFSFGSVLYAMCTGNSPFQANSVIAVVRKVCDEDPPLVHQINPKVPPWLSGIIAKLMAKSPEARFQSAQEVGELLERYLARVQHGELTPLPGSPGLTRRQRTRTEVAVGLAVAAVFVAAAAFALTHRRPATHQGPVTERPSTVLQEPFTVLNESGVRLGGHTNFQDALERTPPGGIVELRWTGPREMPAVTLPPKTITLRAAKGFQPEWIARDLSRPTLSASASLTLEGIRFVGRPASMEQQESTQPAGRPAVRPYAARVLPSGIALVSMSGGSLRIRQCALELKARGAHELACIILSNIVDCRLENTTLLARQAKAIILRQSSIGSQPEGSRLNLTNCVAVAAEVFWLELPEPSRCRIESTRTTFSGPTSFYFPPSFAAELHIDTQQNLFETASVIMDARNAGAPPLQQKVRWQERENLFSPGQSYIMAVAVANKGPTSLAEWDQWWNQTGTGSRQVSIDYASGRSSANRGAGQPPTEARDFQITNLRHFEGPRLERVDWERFGAATASVGPVSAR